MYERRIATARILVAALSVATVVPTALKATELSAGGICPGIVELEITNAQPNSSLMIIWDDVTGSAQLSQGQCVGLETGLETINRGRLVTADANGFVALDVDFPSSGCALYVQAVDLTDCTVSPLNQSPGTLSFTDVTDAAGVRFEQLLDLSIPIGGGAVWADFDNDGWDDLYSAQGSGCNRLFMNNQDGTFTELENGGGAGNCVAVSHGAAVADYDNDGDQDIYVTNNGQNTLFRNELAETGSFTFESDTEAANMNNDGAQNSASASWADYDNDGWLDLAVVQHYDPVLDECLPDLLWHNNGDGTFSNLAGELGIERSGELDALGCGLAVTWSDFDNDGDQDLMIVNDLGYQNPPNRLFRNDGPDGFFGGWTFTDVSASSGFDYSMFGMGIGIGDINRDGYFDYYMSDIGANNLAYNNGDGTFTDVAADAGVEAWEPDLYLGDDGLVSWGNMLVDGDLDGWPDIVVANGGAPEDKFPGMFGDDYVELNPIFWYQNQGDSEFREGHDDIGVGYEKYYRTIAGADYDKDGDVDFFAGVAEGFPELYRNEYPQGILNWLQVKVEGTESNRDGIGSRIELLAGGETQLREIDGGSSFLSRHSLTAHFGLGDVDVIESLIVTFPSGRVVELADVAVNQILEIIEPTE